VKTISLKKVSAVAVASLGFGLLSVVPAHATNVASAVTMAITAPAAANTGTTDVPVAQGTAITASLTLIDALVMTDAADGTDVTFVVTNPLGTVITTSATFTAVAAPKAGITATATGAVVSVRSTGAGGDMTTAGAVIANVTLPATATTVSGFYSITSAVAAVNSAGGTTDTNTGGTQMDGAASLARGKIFVSGSTVTQGVTRGQNGSATSANSAAVTFSTNTHTGLTVYKVLSTGVGSITGATQNVIANMPTGTTGIAATSGVAGSFGSGVTLTTANATTSEGVTIALSSLVAGDQTISFYSVNPTSGTNTLVATSVVTWGAVAQASAQFSLLTLNAEGTAPTTASGAASDTTATIVSKTASTTPKFRIQVVINDQFGSAFPSVMGASITGPGNLGVIGSNAGTTTNPAGRSLTIATNATTGVGSISVYSDGVAGTSVITITGTSALGVTTVLGSKTVTFAGVATKAAVTQNLFVASAGAALGLPTPTTTTGAATTFLTTPAMSVSLTDSTGVAPVAGSVLKMTSSDTSVITVGTCAELTAGTAAQIAIGSFECSVSGSTGAVSGKTATVTVSVFTTSTGLFDVLATPVTFTIGGAIAKVVVSADKTAYDAGAALNLTATATDSSGNKAADGQAPYASISSNKTLITLPATTKFIVNGKTSTTSSLGTASLFAPATVGSFTISGLSAATASAPLGTAYAVTASVNDGNAALMTQIDALNAKIVALNALIAKIMKKLGVK